MKLTNILASAMIGAMILTTVPVVSTDFNTTAEAAKGGAKITMPNLNKKTAPKTDLNKTPAKNESKSVSGGGKTYTPSKNAKDLQNNAPAAKSNANTKAAASSGTGFGNALRSIGLFAGGMMLGGLIGSLFGGFGGGFLSDVLGLLFNIAIFYALYRGGRYLWNKYHASNQPTNKVQDYQPIDITPPQAINYPNQSSLGTDYDSKRTADYYRSL